jgi:hypothetical protein
VTSPGSGTLNNLLIERLYTVPVQTPPDSPLTLTDELGDVWVNSVNVRIPPGHAGQTGLQLQYAGVPIVPWNDITTFLVDNDKDYDFPIGFEFDQSLTIVMYNQGSYPHTFYCRWNVTPIVLLQPLLASGLVPIVQTSTIPDSGP